MCIHIYIYIYIYIRVSVARMQTSAQERSQSFFVVLVSLRDEGSVYFLVVLSLAARIGRAYNNNSRINNNQ